MTGVGLETLRRYFGVDLTGGNMPFNGSDRVDVTVFGADGQEVQLKTRPISVTEYGQDGPVTFQLLKPVGPTAQHLPELLGI